MSDTLRRIYNSIDRLFDIWAITQEMRYSREGGENRSPITALQAFQFVQPVIRELDWQYRLTMIASQNGSTANGTSAHWEFFFNLVRRRAKIACEWVLPWNEAIDDYGQAKMKIIVTPFPAVDSSIRTAVKDGKLLHRQVIGMWRQECNRNPTLPTPFRDTETVMADFVQQGLDVTQTEFSLSTGQSHQGTLCWIAQARNISYYSPFVNSKWADKGCA